MLGLLDERFIQYQSLIEKGFEVGSTCYYVSWIIILSVDYVLIW